MTAPCMSARIRLDLRHMSLAISANSSRIPGTDSSAPLSLEKAPEKSSEKASTRSEPRPLSARKDSFEPSAQAATTPTDPSSSSDQKANANPDSLKPPKASAESKAIGRRLTTDQLQVISNLQARDREVRAHEAAHQAAGGGAVGGASYSYQQGPDGRNYAIGGEVSVDLSASGSPEAVIAKMARVRAAATAPASPSSQDFSVAAAAASIAAAARQEQQAQVITEQTEATKKKETKAEATAALDAQVVQTGSPTSTSPGASTDDVAEGSAQVPHADAKPATPRTQQQKAVSAYQPSGGAVTTRSFNHYA